MRAFFMTGLVLFCAATIAGFVFSASIQTGGGSQTQLTVSNGIATAAQPSNGAGLESSSFANGHISHTAESTAIPAYFIGLSDYAILVEKSTQKLYLYDKDYTLIKTFHVTTGQNQGDKTKRWDRRTPEGVYFFTVVKDDRELLPEYGVMALPINYPNFIDTIQRKNGNGIWFHATNQPDRPLKPFDTRGCVVAANEDIVELADYIKLQTTPLVIVKKIDNDSLENISNIRREILQFIRQWQTSWENKDIESYMDAYSKTFRSSGMDFQKWKAYKENLNRQYSTIQVSVSDMKILRHRDHIVVSFVQHYKSNQEKSVGIKRLYLSHEENGWKIIGEEWGPMPTQAPAMIAKKYAVVKLAKIEPMPAPVVPENKAVVQKVSFEGGKTPFLPAGEGRSKRGFSDKIDIEDFVINKQKAANSITFRLVNKTNERQILSGRLAIVAADKNENQIQYASYPLMPLEQGIPKDFKNGEWYSIRRFKIVKGTINENIATPVTVLVYSTTGELLLQREFPAQADAAAPVSPVAQTTADARPEQISASQQNKKNRPYKTYLSLRGFQVKKESNRLAVSFDLVKTAANGTMIARGYVFIVADYGDTYFTFPKNRKITDGLPADFKRGDTFAIRWQKHIRQSLPYSMNDPAKMITVFVFSADGELLSKKEERIESPHEPLAFQER